ncbi:hypothetical protein QJU11_09990 [Pasteurella atlantica]|uniref:hypothetical protein n=1 Tax=Phocoenobacter atlanticus TaxID=3416742 RepID=UPI002742AB7E|nr:hypothetical protein [Pasteurella atlantica]MDP8042521.1 hypothetical protein [Pasteurella atlantica]
MIKLSENQKKYFKIFLKTFIFILSIPLIFIVLYLKLISLFTDDTKSKKEIEKEEFWDRRDKKAGWNKYSDKQ